MSATTPSAGPRPFWQPHLAGVLLGLGLLMTFVLTGHGLGASGFTTALAATTADVVAPAATESSSYWGPMFENGRNPLDSWITWQVIGAALGALIGAMTAGRFQISYDGPVRLGKPQRLLMAFAGGAISGLGARISLGCTSGLGLSGAATLASAGFLFLGGFFITGAIIGLATKRIWQ
ncbi:MAG: transporter [Xanthomonadaceae bacterium]|nr:transporter [Xanthomonadaceae bacterium]